MSSFMSAPMSRPIQESAAASAIEQVDNDSKSKITRIHPLSIAEGRKLVIYTVGRGNPPHEGHMATIMMAIIFAMENGGIALILLGDGSKDTKGTIENPLDFKLKQKIIEAHIPHQYKPYYAIRQKSASPIGDIKKFIEEKNETNATTFVVHLTADKAAKLGEKSDREKLSFINEGLSKAEFETGSYVIQPTEMGGKEMSATSIREFVVNENREAFIEKYGEFYRDKAQKVYNTIKLAYKKSPLKLKAKYRKVKPEEEEEEELEEEELEEEEELKPELKKARLGEETPNGGTRKHKSGTRKRKNKRKGVTRKRKGKHKRTSRVHR
jgi:hypothetical protein